MQEDPATVPFTDRALANIYPHAWPACSTWPREKWHRFADRPNSSQALCVSTFGSLAQRSDSATLCKAILDEANLVLRPLGAPSIECEHTSSADVLNEFGKQTTPTSVDALITWSNAALAIESKFTEAGFGSCSQPGGTARVRSPQCTGAFERGSDLKTKTTAPCRLTIWDGDRSPRLYWTIGATLFRPEVLTPPQRPCPFSGEHYQLMRNLCFATAYAQKHRLKSFGFLVMYVGASPYATHLEVQVRQFKDLLLPEVRDAVGTLTYERLSELIIRDGGYLDLAQAIQLRIASVYRERR